MTLEAIVFVVKRWMASPDKPYSWKLFIRSGKYRVVVTAYLPCPSFGTAEAAKASADEYARELGITIGSWEYGK